MILLTAFYIDKNSQRQAEFLQCLERNVRNECFNEIHLFVEEDIPQRQLLKSFPALNNTKICLVEHGSRVTYQDFFFYANQHLHGDRVAVANADIYFDETLAYLKAYELAGKLLCLSRWDVQPDGSLNFFEHPSSQDAWIFQAPIQAFPCDFYLGVLGCDNRLAWEAANVGLEILNPSRSIHVCHLHLSQVRRYNKRKFMRGPVTHVPAIFLENAKSRETDRKSELVFALTSLPPKSEMAPRIKQCIRSWRAAGLKVFAFNHPSEISKLKKQYDVEFIPVEETTKPVFGKHFVPIKTMVAWAVLQDAQVLLINSDIHLELEEWEFKRIRWLAKDGLCYFVRHNYSRVARQARREPFGIDAFLFHGCYLNQLPDSFMSMGQPFWDYWIPYYFAMQELPIYSVEYPAAYHKNHPTQWSWENWHRCALEFSRVADGLVKPDSFEGCVEMSLRVRRTFDRKKVKISKKPFSIQDWVQKMFNYRGHKTFFELGSHQGTDTAWLAQVPNVTIHAFEPDPRNSQPVRKNVLVNRAAISDHDGAGSLIMSLVGWGQIWTHSSSIKQPKNHYHRFPVTFGESVAVQLISLDTYYERHKLGIIDFVWADIQGAEGEMIRGGQKMLANTRYLYTEYSDDEMYEGQITLSEILTLLPEFHVVELWPDDVLLENKGMLK